MIRVERVETAEAVERLAPDWDALAARAPQRSLFASAAWLRLWWRHFGESRRLLVLAAREEGELVGVAPLLVTRRRMRGLPVRELGFAINGCSQRSDFVIDAGRKDVAAALAGAIADRAGDWDVARFDGMAEAAGAWAALEPALAARGVRGSAPWTWTSLAIELDADFDAWLAARPRHFRKILRQAEGHLRKLGEPRLERCSEPDALDAALERLLAVERRSWKVREGEAIATQSGWAPFYRDVAQVFAASRACEIRVLVAGDRDLAANFVVRDGDVAYGLRTCYDEAFASASPGRNLMAFLVRDLAAVGVRRLELDRRTAFLAQWADRAETCLTATCFHGGAWSRSMAWLQRGADGARRLSQRLRPQPGAAS
jgi:CelD/BcsL family acetyltransferase involved in cellulose biosynthesis